MFPSAFFPPRERGTMWSKWYPVSFRFFLQMAHLPLCKAINFSDNPAESFPPHSFSFARRLCARNFPSSGFAFLYSASFFFIFSLFAVWYVRLYIVAFFWFVLFP